MKKAHHILLSILLCFSLVGCGSTESSTTADTTTTTSETTTTTTTTTTKKVTTTTAPESKTFFDFTKIGNKSNSNPKSNSKSNNSNSSLSSGEYWCMGKGDTCKNKTSSPTDLYCYSCDPDNNNIEGDQRSNKSYGNKGKVKDNNYDGKVNGDDWEKAWKDYLNDKYNDYGF